MNLEVWFPQQNEVSVFLESSITDPDEEQFYETCLFGLYAARQIANLGAEGASLAYVLQTTDTANPLAQALERLDEVRVVSPNYSGGGRKGFTAELRPDKRAFFKLNGHGFGMLGKGVGYYAPTSTLALLYWLLDRRKDDAVYQRALAATAENVGILGMQGRITVTTQADAGMGAASAAWEEARSQVGADGESDSEDDLNDEVYEACASNGINFFALVADAAGRLHEALAEGQQGSGISIVRDEDALRTCQIETLVAAGLAEELNPHVVAIQAAEAAGDDATIAAANASYERMLGKLIEEHALEPVAEALRSRLFTDDTDKAMRG